MYRTTIYRLHIKCQSERGIEWIYPANAFYIEMNRSNRRRSSNPEALSRTRIEMHMQYSYPQMSMRVYVCMCEVCINTTLPKHNFPLVSDRTRIEKEEISSGGGRASFQSRNVTRSCVLVRIRTATHRVVGRGLVVQDHPATSVASAPKRQARGVRYHGDGGDKKGAYDPLEPCHRRRRY